MATIILSAVGNAIGGPIGGSIGAIIGNQIDQRLFGPGDREGPRLKELKVTTSSYGSPIARHYGRVRAPGSIIWATDLVESSEKTGGGKGKPSTTAFNYSTSFAVALASRPIREIGRIWADGNLLRGAAGDLKVGGELRVYSGFGDQDPDPLLASAEGPLCPAYRGLAYCVFESLQLADFGNRIPTLTFEVIADDGAISLAQMVPEVSGLVEVDRPLAALGGFSEEGGAFTSSLGMIDQVYPVTCDASGHRLAITAGDLIPANPPTLAEAAVDPSAESFGVTSGESRRRQADAREIPDGLRYYDVSRDFQAGLQRADGRARPGRSRIIEFPGVLDASDARDLANKAAERASWSQEAISWRLAELDPALSPGQVVRVPGKTGYWRIESWEWRETGVELELKRLPHGAARSSAADAGASLQAPDLPATPTILHAFELPWDGTGSNAQRQVFAAASSQSAGWSGAALFAEQSGSLISIGASGKARSVVGQLSTELAPAGTNLLDRSGSIEIDLVSEDFLLLEATATALGSGSNRALVGNEIIQFASALRLGPTSWRICNLLRGRGGTETAAQSLHSIGTAFVLLDDAPVALDTSQLGQAAQIAATGLADPDPVVSAIAGIGRSLRPLSPVHPRIVWNSDNSASLAWTRRSRGAWEWLSLVDAPLNEQAEAYLVGLGDTDNPSLHWGAIEPCLELTAEMLATFQSNHSGQPVWVKQIGTYSSSPPLLLFTIA